MCDRRRVVDMYPFPSFGFIVTLACLISFLSQSIDIPSENVSRLEELYARKEQLKSGDFDATEYNQVNGEITQLEEAQQEQQRIEEQTQEVQATVLPQEYEDLFEAKDVKLIEEVLQLQKADQFKKHNEEVKQLKESHKAQLSEVESSSRDEYKESYHKIIADNIQLITDIADLRIKKSDVEHELNKEQIAIGAVQAAKIVIPTNERLTQMTQDRKGSHIRGITKRA